MKRIIAFTLSFLLIPLFMHVTSAEENMVLSMKTNEQSEEVIDVSIDLKNNPGITACLFEIEYKKESFEYINDSLKLSEAFSDGTLLENSDNEGKLIISWFNFGDIDADGNIVTFKLKRSTNVSSREQYIKISYKENDFVNFSEEVVPVICNSKIVYLNETAQDEPKEESDNNVININPNDVYKIENNKEYIWTVGDENIVTIEDGVLKPKEEGNTIVIGQSKDGQEQEIYSVNVNSNCPMQDVVNSQNSSIYILITVAIIVIALLIVCIKKLGARKHETI